MTEYLMVGEVLKPQGVHGEAKLKSYASDPQDFLRWSTLYLLRDGAYMPVEAHCSRVQDDFAYVTLAGCDTPEAVERLRGQEIYIDRAHAAALEEGTVYIADLIGCEAVDEQGQSIGTVTDVLQNGPVDVYVFRTAKGTMMAPALQSAFPEIHVEQGRILVNRERLEEVAVFED